MIQPVMCVNAVVAMMLRVMCVKDVAQMTRWVMCARGAVPMIQPTMMQMTTMAAIVQVVVDAVQMMPPVMTVAVIGHGHPMTIPNSLAVQMPLWPMIAVVEEDRVAAVDAAVMTPPAMTVADVVAVATIRAKFGLPAALDG
jgi:hypothetical protein